MRWGRRSLEPTAAAAIHRRVRATAPCGCSSSTLQFPATISLPRQRNPAAIRFRSDNNRSDDDNQQRQQQEELEQEREALLSHARQLTLRLYRRCLRSVEAIRHGNAADEQEFRQRERQREASLRDLSSSQQQDPRWGMLSVLPPVNRHDELRSRAAYYRQHAREMVHSEWDCLTHPSPQPLARDSARRYLHHVRHGEHTRQWLLRDMKFDDPVAQELLEDWEESVARWQDRAELYFARLVEDGGTDKLGGAAAMGIDESDDESDSDDDDGFWTESDSDSDDSD